MQLQSTPSTRRYWPLWELITARLREFLREPEAVFWVYIFPVLMIIALGIAFRNQRVEQIVVDVVAGPAAQQTRDALATSATPERFKVEIRSEEEARLRLRTGKTDVIVQAGGSAATRSASKGAVQEPLSLPGRGQGEGVAVSESAAQPSYEYLFDPTRPQSVLARSAVDDQLQRAAGRQDVAVVELVPIDRPGGRYIDFLVPGLVAMGLMGGGLWGVGFVTVDMRIRKLLKRFLATPMKKIHFLAGVIVSRMVGMVPEVVIVLVFARYAFGVVNHGSVWAVGLLVLLGSFMFAALGLLVASRARTIEAVSGLMNLVQVPMWILSGIFFSSERFPEAAQPFIKALPLTPLIDALRAVMLEGATLASQAARIGIMAAWAAVTFFLAVRWFRWQ